MVGRLRSKHITAKSEKVAISLPRDVLIAVEAERRATGESRSAFFRRAAQALLRRQLEKQAVQAYIRAYQRHPETAEEMEAINALGMKVLAREPWE